MSKTSSIVVSTVVFTAFIVSMFAGVEGQNTQVPDQVFEEISAPEAEGDGAPFGSWTPHVEEVVTYFHSDTPVPQDEDTGIPVPPSGDEFVDGYFDYARPQHVATEIQNVNDQTDPLIKRVMISSGVVDNTLDDGSTPDSPARFQMVLNRPYTDNSTPVFSRDVEFFEIEIEVEAVCGNAAPSGANIPQSAVDPNIGIDVHLDLMELVDGTWQRRDMVSSTSTTTGAPHNPWRTILLETGDAVADSNTGTYTYRGEWESPENPLLGTGSVSQGEVLPAGTRLEMSFFPNENFSDCIIYFDVESQNPSGTANDIEGYTSFARFVTDTGRLNTWFDDKEGDFTEALPSAASTAPPNRKFKVQIAHHSIWPHFNDLPGADDTNYQDRQFDGNLGGSGTFTSFGNDHRKHLRVWNRDPGVDGRVYDSRTGTWPSIVHDASDDRETRAVGNSTNIRTYDFAYTGQLPDASYQAEAYSLQFGNTFSPLVTVGLKAFQISALGNATHEINPGEPTVFRVLVQNTGAERDTITTTVSPPGANWQADVINGKLTVEPGGDGEVLVLVTPPSTATAGTSKDLEIRSVSAFPNEVDTQTLTLTAKVVSGGDAGAKLLGDADVVEIFAGEQIDLSGLRIHNEAPFLDTYLIKAVLPSDIQGWTVSANPPSRTLHADSIDDFTLTVKAPTSAPQGLKFNLAVQAVRVGGTAPADNLVLPVEVVLVPALDLGIGGPSTVPLRSDGSGGGCTGVVSGSTCIGAGSPAVDDVDHDRSMIGRIEITNPTPAADEYRIRGGWTRGTDASGTGSCTDNSHGPPDYWRSKFGSIEDMDGSGGIREGAAGTAFSTRTWETVEVPPFTTVYRYMQLNWVDPGSSCDLGDVASDVDYTLEATSLADQSVVKSVVLNAKITDAGSHVSGQTWSGAQHDVAIEPDRVDGKQRFVDTSGAAVREGDAYAAAEYGFRVMNRGNEHDSLIVEVPASTKAGWSRFLEWDGDNTTSGVQCDSVQSEDRRWRCPGMGIGDEASFRLVVQPEPHINLRNTLDSPVIVKSDDDGAKADELSFSTRTVGEFSFAATALKEIRKAPQGSDVTLPFEISNEGTADDTYVISIIDGDADWKPRLSSDQKVFVPGSHKQTGFAIVSVPDDEPLGDKRTFRIQVTSENDAGIDVLDYEVEVISAGSLLVSGVPSNSLVLPARGAPNEVTVRATSDSGPDGMDVAFGVDQQALADGWTVDAVSKTAAFAPGTDGAFEAEVKFQVTPPVDGLSTSRVPFIVTGTTQETDPAQQRSVSRDIVLSLEATVGVELVPLTEIPQTIVPGGQVVYEVDVVNEGLAQDTIALSNTAMPAGWNVLYTPAEPTLGPLEARTIEILVDAPLDAPPAANISFELFAASASDAAVFDSLTVSTVVGFNALGAQAAAPVARAAPEETATYVVTVENQGTLPDEVRADVDVTSVGLEPFVSITVSPSESVGISVNTSRDFLVQVATSGRLPSEVAVHFNVSFVSLVDTRSDPAETSVELVLQAERYVGRDIDQDLIREYAIDRNRDLSDGYEEFKESKTPGGKTSRLAQLDRFLSNESRESFMVQVTNETGNTSLVFRFMLDGDEDGRWDHFVDTTGDGLPNVYWDPDSNHSVVIGVIKDVDADNIVDYFVDVDGDGQLDRVYNVVTGRWTDLIVRDIDGDGTIDYGVDANGNGQIDADETVLFTRGGQLIAVQKIDVDGDGRLDEVYDIDGDGKVDFFIRAGETESRPITLKDVNGDGVADWVYDSNLDGKDDAYYDPVAKQGGLRIDSQASFLRMAGEYWYIPALFALVLVLFVVLLAVTRR